MTRPKDLVDFALKKGTLIEVFHGMHWWNAQVLRDEKNGVVKIGYVQGTREDEEEIRIAQQPYRIRRMQV
jgi:hypothetical protein